MSGYQRPVDAPVSCSWQCHLDRSPPSSEPGTDYACAYGTPVAAADNGTVTDLQTNPAGATGRYVTVQLHDGRTTRDLHLSSLLVGLGEHVARGQLLGYSGASGHGTDWYYGPHLHRTLWPGKIWEAPTIDFELYVGGGTPPPTTPDEENDMTMKGAYYPRAADGATVFILFNENSGFWTEHTTTAGGTYNNPIAQGWETNSWPPITESHALGLKASLDKTRAASAGTATAAWAIGAGAVLALALIAVAIALFIG